MAAVLGVSAHYHDSAAALLVDGRVAAALQEERVSRVKNDASLPLRAARACLRLAGLDARDLDEVVFYEDPYARVERTLTTLVAAWPRGLAAFPRALRGQLGGKLWVLDALATGLGVPRSRVTFRAHHESHAASAFLVSPFPRAAVLTVDGAGEWATTALWRGEGGALTLLEETRLPHSLGLLYAAFTAYLGFEVNEGEYKVMGLAAHGRPRFALDRVLQLADDGTFALDPSYLDPFGEVGFSPKLEGWLGPRRPPGRPWDLATLQDARYADIAASLQDAVERALVGLARRARRLTGLDALCLAGGVALNAVANARVAREAGFSHVFVQPAAGDAGGALGAAALAAADRGDPRVVLGHAAWGLPVDGAVAAALAEGLGLRVARVSDPADEAAERIARGEVVAWCAGRSEWGPRALGHRSLLALPGPASVRDRLNGVVKRREAFRPFAPAIAAEELGRHVAEPVPPWLGRFMTTVAPIRSDADLSAVTHVDGTGRVQIVADHGPFARLLAAVGARTGARVVLNTSLNGRGEPIAATEADAVAFFLSHPADALVIEDAVVTRSR